MAALAVVMVPLTGCGTDPTPAEAVPELSQRLEQVDAALATGQQNKAREAIDALLDEAAQARVDGDLSADQADQILRAATELKRALGDVGSDGSTSDPFHPPEVSEDEHREGEDQESEESDRDEKEKKEKQDEKGRRGKGSSQGSGPDNVHGSGG